jgi:hypothetical protein
MIHGVLVTGEVSDDLLWRIVSFSFDLYDLTNNIVASVDPETGQPFPNHIPVCFTPTVIQAKKPTAVVAANVELDALRNHNLRFESTTPQDTILLFAEGALSIVMVEATCRKALSNAGLAEADGGFDEVLEQAVLGIPKLLQIPVPDDTAGVKKMIEVRNSILHGNYEQAAENAGCKDVNQYFKTMYASEIEGMYQICQFMRKQFAERGAMVTGAFQ